MAISNIVINILGMLWRMAFMTGVLGSRFKSKTLTGVLLVLSASAGSLIWQFSNIRNQIADYCMMALILFIFSLLFLKGAILKKLLLSIFTFELVKILVFITAALISIFPQLEYNSVISGSLWASNLFQLANLAILCFIGVPILRFIRKRGENRREMLILVLVATLSLAIIMAMSPGQYFRRSFDNPLVLVVVAGVIGINLVILYLFYKLNQEYQVRVSLQQRYQYQEKYMREIRAFYDSARQIRHDMKNYTSCLRGLIESRNFEEAENYLNKFEKSNFYMVKRIVFTSNDAINSILDNKFSYCETQGIKYDYMILGDLDHISDIDISIILGNLLDNAIEACGDCDVKFVYVEIRSVKQYLKIHVENTEREEVLKKNPHLRTTKQDKEAHGLGIKSVQQIADKYDGMTDFYEEGGRFKCNVFLKRQD